MDEAWRKAAREALRAAAGPLASREYRLTRQREGLEEIRSIRRNWEARGDMTEEDRRELDRTETEMLDTISAEEDGLILDELFDGMEDPSWPHVETEAELQDKIDRMTALRQAYEAYEELVALYRRKDQRMSTKTTTDEFVPQPYPLWAPVWKSEELNPDGWPPWERPLDFPLEDWEVRVAQFAGKTDVELAEMLDDLALISRVVAWVFQPYQLVNGATPIAVDGVAWPEFAAGTAEEVRELVLTRLRSERDDARRRIERGAS